MHELSLPSEYQIPLPDISPQLSNEELIGRFRKSISRIIESIDNPGIKPPDQPELVLWFDGNKKKEEREPVGLVRDLDPNDFFVDAEVVVVAFPNGEFAMKTRKPGLSLSKINERLQGGYRAYKYDEVDMNRSWIVFKEVMEEHGFDGEVIQRSTAPIITPYQAEAEIFGCDNPSLFFERELVANILGEPIYAAWSVRKSKPEPKSVVRRLIDKIPNIR